MEVVRTCPGTSRNATHVTPSVTRACQHAESMRPDDMNRDTDVQSKVFFRSERFFLSQGQWYCTTREGPILGPFAERGDAVAALREYLLSLGVRIESGIWDRPGTSN